MNIVSEISPFYFILLSFFSLVVAFLLYSGKEGKQFSRPLKWLLLSLRALGLFLIGLLFLGLFLQTSKVKSEKPIFINLIDNSSSMRNYADSNSVKVLTENYLKDLNEQYGKDYTIRNFTIGASFSALDSLTFSEDRTNLANGFSNVIEQFYGNNIGAITLISDGNFNEGDHPLYTASNLMYTPVFTLGVGDTITKKDLIVRAVQSNDFVFLNNSFPVEALIEAKKIGRRSVNVRLVHQGKTIKSSPLEITSDNAYYKVNFEVEAKEKGVQYYQVIVDEIAGEYTTKNNRQGFYIEVIDDMRKILLLASAPHPDIAALKSVLEKEKNNKVESKTIQEWDKKASDFDLIIFHNPLTNSNEAILKQIINEKVSVLAILGANSNFRTDLSALGMGFTSINQMDENVPIFNSNFDLFELSPDTKRQIRNFPPLRSVFGKMKLSPTVKPLFYQGVGEIQKEDPQLYFHTMNDVKIGVIQGEGIWRWKLANYRTVENTDAFEEIFQKTAQYLTVKKNNSPFRVTVPRKANANEAVIVKAEVYNASMQLVTNANVNFKLIATNGSQQVYDFSVVNNYYSLNLGKIPAGNYKWIASTQIDGKPQQINGELVIEVNDIESLDNTANFEALHQLSTQTDANFYPIAQYKELLNVLQKREDIRPIETQEKTVKNLIDYWWLLLLIVTVFGTEWFLKRYNGSY